MPSPAAPEAQNRRTAALIRGTNTLPTDIHNTHDDRLRKYVFIAAGAKSELDCSHEKKKRIEWGTATGGGPLYIIFTVLKGGFSWFGRYWLVSLSDLIIASETLDLKKKLLY
ncbi:unnamed protein product [Caenorhabditis auriculariae]|uniref:Uncharacterized protein n=1 Tax=Caenorhabditis auriculariae TaxID=2777116 RepID=A0A8S1HLV9_9PELO|nr:unnamed protein product [Caenorhabditis auriculariae]